MAMNIAILGAGIAGLASAIALKKHLPDSKLRITVIEVRSTPSTIGGAVNLTPKALRYLDYLGVLGELSGADCKKIEIFDLYTGKRAAELDFSGPDGDGIGEIGKRYFAKRVMRAELQAALLKVCRRLDDVEVLFGKKTISIDETSESVKVAFEGGGSIDADAVLGCDGIHSAVRSLLIDPSRKPSYTGVAASMAISKVRGPNQLRWQTTGLVSSRKGSFMASYIDDARKEHYISVVVETPEVSSREGWKLKGSDQAAMKKEILERFSVEAVPELRELVQDAGDWSLYPVYQLPQGGKWISPGGRCILLGDAAHAMPPQGESTGICIEDAIVFSRAMIHYQEHPLNAILEAYETFRRPKTDAEVAKAVQRWENVKDKGWFAHQMLMLITPWFLWWTAKGRDEEFAEDLTDLNIDV